MATLTIKRGSDPVEECGPKVHPTYKREVIGRVGLLLYDVKNCLVKESDGPWASDQASCPLAGNELQHTSDASDS